jgi:hypothetical protein
VAVAKLRDRLLIGATAVLGSDETLEIHVWRG